MKKDIIIPEVKNISLAVALEYNEVFKTEDWNVYLLNNNREPLELVLIVSKGFDGKKETSTLRHKLDVLPARSGAKIEFLQNDVLTLHNEFKITYFINGVLFEKVFLIKKNTVNNHSIKKIDMINKKGIIIED